MHQSILSYYTSKYYIYVLDSLDSVKGIDEVNVTVCSALIIICPSSPVPWGCSKPWGNPGDIRIFFLVVSPRKAQDGPVKKVIEMRPLMTHC